MATKIIKLMLGATRPIKFHPLSAHRPAPNARQTETTILHHI
jgi:hypothetical protein